MPHVLQGREPLGPDGELPRATIAVADGHQIRIVVLDGDTRLRVTCVCQLDKEVPWVPLVSRDDARTWRKYNQLPHDAEHGPFTPVDEGTGQALDQQESARLSRLRGT